MRTGSLVGVLFGLCIASACRGEPAVRPDAAPDAGLMRIQDVQSDAMAVGAPVELIGVIVTAIDTFGARTGDFWVQDPEGGPFSGVHVFGAQVSQIAELQIGDVVSITGATKTEFVLSSDMSGRTTTELQPPRGGTMTVTRIGNTTPPEPHVLDAVALGKMTAAERDAEYERWEGVLITVKNVGALSGPVGFGSQPFAVDSFKFEVNGKLVVESLQAPFPTSIDGTTCLASVTGVEDYFFDWLIVPRTTEEIVLGGTACPVIAPTRIVDIQTGAATGTVVVNNVFVTAVTARTLWLADALQGAENNGVAVFYNNAMLDPGIVVGAKLNVQGTVTEFDVGNPRMGDTVTQIINPSFTAITAPAGPPVPLAVTAAQVSDLATGEKYEGVLVQGNHFKVKTVGQFNQVTLVDNAGGTVIMDDDIFANYGGTQMAPVLPAVGTCFERLTGVMNVQLTANLRTLNPRSTADLVAGTGCTVSVVDIQVGAVTGGVVVNNVVVTAVGANTLWVADELQAAQNNGVAVFFDTAPLDPGIVVGARLTVAGTVREFDATTPPVGDTLTQIISPVFTNIVAPAGPPVPAAVTTAQVASITTGELFEGVLVALGPLKVTAIGARNQVTLTDNLGGTVVLDDDIFANYGGTAPSPALPAINDCFATMTGVMSVQLIDNVRTINPRSAADMVLGTGCTETPAVTVVSIQTGVAVGTVFVRDVFVTARGANTLWVADALQGAVNNGVAVFFSSTVIDPAIVVGARLNVNGVVTEFDVGNPPVGDKLTEIITPAFINVTPPGPAPTPLVVTVPEVSDIGASGEPFEGVLVQAASLKVTAIGTGNKVTLTDTNGATITMDDDIFANYGGGATPTPPAINTCFETLTGIMSVQLTDNIRTINPRSAADMVVGTGCTPTPARTVAEIQTGAATANVFVPDVFVTARSANTVWVADDLQGAANNGVAVFVGSATLDPGIVIGAQVTVNGVVSEFDVGNPRVGDTVTQIVTASFAGITAPTGPPTPLVVTSPEVSDIGAPGEPFEGVFVQIAQLKVTAIGTGNQVTLTDNNGATIVMDDDIFANYGGTPQAPTPPAIGTCFETLTGVMNVQLVANVRTINPRAAGDMAIGPGCN